VKPETVAIPGDVHDILDDKPTGFVATLRPDGRISVTPVGLLFDAPPQAPDAT
jgi:hypothetical protein